MKYDLYFIRISDNFHAVHFVQIYGSLTQLATTAVCLVTLHHFLHNCTIKILYYKDLVTTTLPCYILQHNA